VVAVILGKVALEPLIRVTTVAVVLTVLAAIRAVVAVVLVLSVAMRRATALVAQVEAV